MSTCIQGMRQPQARIIVYLCVTALFPVFLDSVLSSREGVLVDLGLDLLGRVRQVDRTRRVAGRHLRLGLLHRKLIVHLEFCAYV